MSQHARCSFLGLPVELRMVIFEFALAGEHISLQPRRSDHKAIKWNGTALLAINSQTRHEALPVYLDNVTFDVRHGLSEQDFRRWMAIMGHENLTRLRRLAFHCVGRCSMYGLQPDTDYCHRSATLTREDSQDPNAFQLRDVDMCSNRAFGCLEMGKAALDRLADGMTSSSSCRGEMRPNATDLLDLFTVMTEDQSSSAA